MERNTPCQTCRSLHISCKWPADTSINACTRCTRLRGICSGPVKKSRPACGACKRARAKCIYDADRPSCRRCVRLARTCVEDGRSEDGSAAGSSTRSAGMTLNTSSKTLWGETSLMDIDLYSGPIRQALVYQGLMRLNAMNMGIIYRQKTGKKTDLMSSELLDLIASVSCLRYSNAIVQGSDALDAQVLPIEQVTNRQWLSGPMPKASFQSSGLVSFYRRTWNIIPRLSCISNPDRHTLLQLMTALRLAWKLGIENRDQPELGRCVLAFVVRKALPELEKPWENQAEKNEFADSAIQCAYREAEISISMGVASQIPVETVRKIVLLDTGSMDDNTDMTPLIAINADSSNSVFTHLWSSLMRPTVGRMNVQKRILADSYAPCMDSVQVVLDCWTVIDKELALLDSLTHTVTIFNSFKDPDRDSEAVLVVLRGIACCELWILQSVMSSLIAARRLEYALTVGLEMSRGITRWTLEVVQRILKILDVVMLHETSVSRLHHVLDMTVKTIKLGRDFLLPVVQCLDGRPRELVLECLKIASFWDAGSPALLEELGGYQDAVLKA
ncbi:hypothetical protein BD324DRAFT_151106 [Kockovaella imperatae]|uniref:Zn(2)-C6 fungal-type domain-containing protein n=1 Tax=Kockovaella imperatae TaxID=4999 RepID=A0A1Y1U8T1_9TREE|nr:hypothetical protein BD324DRAFT_151106 [Kockovaella imperatae]ORX34451.1 hypothetical protein BD324DRAFT_151106 [Kockovaella imperatae]